MTREIKVNGKSFMLYRVNGFDNAWCSDRSLARRIQRRRKQFLDELQTGTKEVREVRIGARPFCVSGVDYMIVSAKIT